MIGQRCAGRNFNGRRCCTPLNPCDEGEGDCDGQHDGHLGCKGDFVCGSNNCRKFGLYYHEKDDCCERPGNTSGETYWAQWSEFSSCSVRCGHGRKTRTRNCVGPKCGITQETQERVCVGSSRWCSLATEDPDNIKSMCPSQMFKSPDYEYNTGGRKNAEKTDGVKSISDCSDLCKDRSDCQYWTWHHAGPYAFRCVTMSDAKTRYQSTNAVSGTRNCM